MITEKYILFTRINITKSADGKYYTDNLWSKDIEEHLKYIKNFELCCPVTEGNKGDLVEVPLEISKIYPLRIDKGLISVARNLTPNFLRVAAAVKKADIVHSGGAGWSFPLSFYILLLRPFLTFKWIMVIESSFWMLEKGKSASLREKINHHVHFFMLKKAILSANARVFTQTFYRDLFLKNTKTNTLINAASWVDQKFILTTEAVQLKYDERHDQPLKIFFPTRLIAEKGVRTVLQSLPILDKKGIKLEIAITGVGPLQDECKEAANKEFKNIHVKFIDPVTYGKAFFELVDKFDYVLIANLKEEQPRIIFDAFGRGVSVIASSTTGICDIVDSTTASLFKPGNVDDLVNVLDAISKNRNQALTKGLAGLDSVKNYTHSAMHDKRRIFLEETL